MRTLFIGDIHGSEEWKGIIAKTKYVDAIVFLGDYVDSFHVDPQDQKSNLLDIFQFADSDERVTLLLGNHDYAYVFGFSGISGYQIPLEYDFRDIFNSYWNQLDIAWSYFDGNNMTLATHAGMTNKFHEEYLINNVGDLKTNLNSLKNKKDIMFSVGPMRGGAPWDAPGPLWADFDELIQDPLEDINQVVGHTPNTSTRFYNVTSEEGNNYSIIGIDNRFQVGNIILELENYS